jgi:hypothetical protein
MCSVVVIYRVRGKFRRCARHGQHFFKFFLNIFCQPRVVPAVAMLAGDYINMAGAGRKRQISSAKLQRSNQHQTLTRELLVSRWLWASMAKVGRAKGA